MAIGRLKAVLFAVSVFLAVSPSALANGFGENRPWQFRSENQRQVLLNAEQIRLQLLGQLGVGGASGLGSGLGSQTGNAVSITINGSGNNTINVDASNTGNQTISDNVLNN